jgi:hypothetical protein
MRLLVAVLCVLSALSSSSLSQPVVGTSNSTDHADMKAYRTLFRQAVLYKRLADQAETSTTPKPQLRRILAARYGFNDADNATLLRLALAYETESDAIHQKVLTIFKKDQERFQSGKIPRGADTSPPPELRVLQSQEDALTLHYRDLLRTSMREEDFQRARANIVADLEEIPLTNTK